MTAKDDALAALAAAHCRVRELTDQLAEARQERLQRVADALNAEPPATWEEIGAATGQGRAVAHQSYRKHLTVDVHRTVTVKPAGRQP